MKEKPSQAAVRRLLAYDQASGVFVWNRPVGAGARLNGTIAGSPRLGYRRIKIAGRLYPASHLAWLYVNGVWPEAEIDHINGDNADDRISNLRPATQLQNTRNRKPHKGSA